MTTAPKTITLNQSFCYHNLTDWAEQEYRRWPDLDDAQRAWVIQVYSALEATPTGDIKAGREYPLSGAVLLDIFEEHGETQAYLGRLLGFHQDVIRRRIAAERRLRSENDSP